MLPDIRAVIAAIVAAACLLIVAFGAVAMFRVAQETRVASLQADLAQRTHPVTSAPPRRVTVIETPGPTLLAKAPAVEPPVPAPTPEERTPAAQEAPAPQQDDSAPLVTAAIPESSPAPDRVPEREANDQPAVIASVPASDPPVTAANEIALDTSTPPADAAADLPAPRADMAAAPQNVDTPPPPPTPPPAVLAMGGPSPEEIAQAKARHELAKRARARRAAAEARRAAAEARKAAAEARKKIAAENARKRRLARLAHQRKLAARQAAEARAKQAAPAAPQQQSGFGFNATSSFTGAPFGSSFNTNRATTNWR